jgi:hypothetical protein
MSLKVGSLRQYIYFLSLPTVLYRDHYPRYVCADTRVGAKVTDFLRFSLLSCRNRNPFLWSNVALHIIQVSLCHPVCTVHLLLDAVPWWHHGGKVGALGVPVPSIYEVSCGGAISKLVSSYSALQQASWDTLKTSVYTGTIVQALGWSSRIMD